MSNKAFRDRRNEKKKQRMLAIYILRSAPFIKISFPWKPISFKKQKVGNCYYCGLYGPLTKDHSEPAVEGNQLKDNKELVCWSCNQMKGRLPKEKFIYQIRRIYERLLLKK